MTRPRFFLDTNICIYLRRRRPPEVISRFKALSRGEAGMSAISFGELMFGVMKSQDPSDAASKLREFASIVPILGLPDIAAEHYGRVRARLQASGNVIGANDLWIAAHALAENLILVTNNEREFRRVGDLRVENWVAGS